jgi:crossover junction endodeoxyribonuclease RusA
MSEPVVIQLGFPPSVNTYWRTISTPKGNRTLISKRGREFRKQAMYDCCVQQANARMLSGRLSVTITLYPPSKHRRDVDNYVKAPLDALTHAGVWLDDEQIDELRIVRGDIKKGGQTVIEIKEHEHA